MLSQEKNIFTLMSMKLRAKDDPKVGDPRKMEEMLEKYYRFKMFWKQEAIKKFMEGHLGIKMSAVKEFQKTQSS